MIVPRIGVGYDSHRFIEGRPLIVGGVTIPYSSGLDGHSDADVLSHAVVDALLGAMAAGDIGTLFPNTDADQKDRSSMEFLREVRDLLSRSEYVVGNIDVVIIAEEPRMAPHVPAMRAAIAGALGIESEVISIKGKTNEGMGAIGKGEGIAVHAVALLLPA